MSSRLYFVWAQMAVALAVMLVLGGLQPGSAQAAPASGGVETFVQQDLDACVKILQDTSQSEAQRHAKLRAYLLQILDLKRVALFTLGSWRRNAAQADLDDFVAAFRDFALANYDARISDYGGQSLKVIGSRKNAADDYIVSTVMLQPGEALGSGDQLEVDLRVLDESGKFVIVDASVEGIWLALTEREDFSGFLGQNNGDVKALTKQVRQRIAMVTGGASKPN